MSLKNRARILVALCAAIMITLAYSSIIEPNFIVTITNLESDFEFLGHRTSYACARRRSISTVGIIWCLA